MFRNETGFDIQSDGRQPEDRSDKVRSYASMDVGSKVFYLIALFFRGFNIAIYYYLMPFGIIAFTLIYAYRFSFEADLNYLQK
jgi:hypothetical protein